MDWESALNISPKGKARRRDTDKEGNWLWVYVKKAKNRSGFLLSLRQNYKTLLLSKNKSLRNRFSDPHVFVDWQPVR